MSTPSVLLSLAAAFTIFTVAPDLHADDVWQTLKQRSGVDGWILSSRAKSGSEFVEYRIVADVAAPPRDAAAAARRLLVEPDHLPTGVRRTILRNDVDVIVSYSRFALPGPLSDRDVVLRVDAFELPSGAVGFRWNSAPELGPPVTPGVVRMRKSSGGWEFTPNANGTVRAVGLMHGDLGGYVPAFLVNRMAGDSLVKDLRLIREMAGKRGVQAATSTKE